MSTADLVSRYIVLTKEVMPHLARTSHKHWPALSSMSENTFELVLTS
jgi:hypothetical protein